MASSQAHVADPLALNAEPAARHTAGAVGGQRVKGNETAGLLAELAATDELHDEA